MSSFTTLPNQIVNIPKCPYCGTAMDVKRNVLGTYKHSGAKYFDTFCCPFKVYDWHREAERIKHEAADMASPSLKKIMEDDFNDIVARNLSILSNLAGAPASVPGGNMGKS
ncbi:MAG: hypothetical protein Hyperionvirus1_90 [Hyperionvirus sp.]|uniref:Uncharacterized protein n=1 Tax=Hyperionvirus sp. TaxID=2487770 RepID=A0A3G5A8K5_9VIRU|nr:MAG: hypothetical protein Hyperionvirus1_90 [Hyperionvirus sp.]